jgi:hypothetical protein
MAPERASAAQTTRDHPSTISGPERCTGGWRREDLCARVPRPDARRTAFVMASDSHAGRASAGRIATHTEICLCGAVQAGGGSDRPFGLISSQTHSILLCNRCYRMSEGAMPTGCGPRPSCPITSAPLCGGGAWWCLPCMGACATVMCQPRSASLRIYIHLYTCIHDGLGTVFGAHGQ